MTKDELVSQAGGAAITSTLCLAVWLVTGAGAFWPQWVVYGLTLALVSSAWQTYKPL